MSDDPTRIMRGDGNGRRGNGRPPTGPEDQQRHLRFLLVALLAVIAGLIIAVVVISSGDSSNTEPTGTTDVPAITPTTTDGGLVDPTDEAGPTGGTGTTGTNSGGVSPELAPDSGGDGSGGITPGSGGVSPGTGTDGNGSDGSSGGISP